jgi:hypothetical protein
MYHRLGIALVLAALAAACGVTDPSKNQVQTFTGTLQPSTAATGQQTPNINVSKTGEIIITVTSLTPPVPLGTFFGVIFGQVVSNQCAVFSNNQFATVGTTAIDTQVTSGTWCIIIYDPRGIFTVPEDFVIKVSHP